jgi:type IV secretory pathway TraG/TraD family ATPase VirD4
MTIKIGRVNFRDDKREFGIKEHDLFQHFYVIGKTGTGKSSLLSYMAMQDTSIGNGFCVIDPHGDMVSDISRQLKILGIEHTYLDLADPNCPYGYNPLKYVNKDRISLAVSGFLETMKSAWSDAWGVRMEHILRNSLYALMEIEGSKISDILMLLGDEAYRKTVCKKISNQTVKLFFEKEYMAYSPGYRQDGVAAIQNKIGAFLSDPLLRQILTEPKQDISLRRIMDKGHILLVNLAKGRIGSDSANLLGGLLVSTIGLAAFSRADQEEYMRKPFFLYVDEFQHFTTLSVVSMLSELRKYKVGMIFAHQYVHQLSLDIRHAIFGNVGSTLVFRVGAEDAPILSKELFDTFTDLDLLRLPNHHFYLKLLIDGQPTAPFSGVTIEPKVKEIEGK